MYQSTGSLVDHRIISKVEQLTVTTVDRYYRRQNQKFSAAPLRYRSIPEDQTHKSASPSWAGACRRFCTHSGQGLIVVIVRDDVLSALEKADVAAVVGALVAHETVPGAVAEAMEDTVSSAAGETDRSTNQAAG